MKWTQEQVQITNLPEGAEPFEVSLAVPDEHDMALQRGTTGLWLLHHRPSQAVTVMLIAPLEAWQAVLTRKDLDDLAALVAEHVPADYRPAKDSNELAGRLLESGFRRVLSDVCKRLLDGGWAFYARGVGEPE